MTNSPVNSTSTDTVIRLPMTIQEIRRYLPHRYPMALVDRVTAVEKGVSIAGYKNISVNEQFLQGHFANAPIMPGVLTIEAMAQLAGILMFITIDKTPQDNVMFLLAGIDNARFKKQAIPGDRLDMQILLTSQRRNVFMFQCTSAVDNVLVASADIMLIQQDMNTI